MEYSTISRAFFCPAGFFPWCFLGLLGWFQRDRVVQKLNDETNVEYWRRIIFWSIWFLHWIKFAAWKCHNGMQPVFCWFGEKICRWYGWLNSYFPILRNRTVVLLPAGVIFLWYGWWRAVGWDDPSDSAKLICHGVSPHCQSPDSELVGNDKVGYVAQSFNIPEIRVVESAGSLSCLAGAIEDANGIGECCQVGHPPSRISCISHLSHIP